MMVGCSVCLVVWSFLWMLASAEGDAEVSCVFMESCILPCSFQSSTDVVIFWIHVTAGDTLVHSYYHNQDQLGRQDQRFRGRTSLFKDQISGGNASLQLTGVQVQDQGRYKCYTSTIAANKESFINLQVDAPVHKVDMEQEENRITCSSEGIYPEPELTWSTSPPSNVAFKNTTSRVQQTEQLLYNINSSLILSDRVTDLVYSCTVSTRSNRRRATLRELTSLDGSSSDTTIPCSASNTSLLNFSLVWRFNHSRIILNRTRTSVPYTVSEEWRQQVKGVSESGSLTLQDLSLKQEGIYTCELSDDEETNITNTLLRIEEGSQTGVTRVIVGLVVGAIFVVVLAGLGVRYYKRKSHSKECETRDKVWKQTFDSAMNP
ncbi:V-set domain-containing T-cell activation inhibitor 1-like isoform X5 [Micropterus salmoides]|uniref:V-set domain-containing T-cell activation inhibitor 1-like isoform X5 n=1 Tax=Micropterus salmoides TaxID=27706 RepID=UPI0018EC340B|nr:V-set domain-containing T-cell activation inhibitor 1-like isoform X5 [Micropterus salmoides]